MVAKKDLLGSVAADTSEGVDTTLLGLALHSKLVEEENKRSLKRWHLSVLANTLSPPSDRLKALVYLSDVTPRQIAERTGLGRRYVESLIDGSAYPTTQDVFAINDAYRTVVGENLLH